MAAAKPQCDLQAKHDESQAGCAIPVTTAQAIVVSRQEDSAQQDGKYQKYPRDITNFPPDSTFVLFGTLRLCPLPDEREKNRFAAPRCCFNAQGPTRSRPLAGPCHARVCASQRIPSGLHWLKL